jgi:hypothetical protein
MIFLRKSSNAFSRGFTDEPAGVVVVVTIVASDYLKSNKIEKRARMGFGTPMQ